MRMLLGDADAADAPADAPGHAPHAPGDADAADASRGCGCFSGMRMLLGDADAADAPGQLVGHAHFMLQEQRGFCVRSRGSGLASVC